MLFQAKQSSRLMQISLQLFVVLMVLISSKADAFHVYRLFRSKSLQMPKQIFATNLISLETDNKSEILVLIKSFDPEHLNHEIFFQYLN